MEGRDALLAEVTGGPDFTRRPAVMEIKRELIEARNKLLEVDSILRRNLPGEYSPQSEIRFLLFGVVLEFLAGALSYMDMLINSPRFK